MTRPAPTARPAPPDAKPCPNACPGCTGHLPDFGATQKESRNG